MPLAFQMVNRDASQFNGLDEDTLTLHKEYIIDSDSIVMNRHAIISGRITLNNGMVHTVERDPSVFNGVLVKSVMDEDEEDLVLREWGHYNDIVYFRNPEHDLYDWLNSAICKTTFNGPEGGSVWQRICVFRPFRSQLKPGYISITQNREKFDSDKQTALKPGRAIKTMFPEMTDAEIEEVVDKFRHAFCDKDYIVKVGSDRTSFRHAYSHDQEAMQNPYTTSQRKSLANSCMRYSFDHLPCHPAEAFASGEFKILWVENQNGEIAARCVVGTAFDKPQAGPIYGTSETAMDLIQNKLVTMHAREGGSWSGATLLKIDYDGGFVGPYLDLHPQALMESDEGLVVDSCGDIDASNYSGLLNAHDMHCESCGDGIRDDESYSAECTDYYYCEDCFHDRFMHCEYTHEYFHTDDAVVVYQNTRWGVEQVYVSEHDVDYINDIVWVEHRGEWWDKEGLHYSEYNDEWFTDKELEDGSFWFCEEDGDYYPEDYQKDEEE